MVAWVVVLAALTAVLAWPAPTALARAGWPLRHPARALVVWQVFGLAGGLALLATELGVALLGPPAAWAGLLAFAGTAIWLFAVLITSTVRVARGRRRHRYLLDLLAERDADGVSVLTHETAAAYSVPGRDARIVVSQGACDSLDSAGLRAVVEHERAHLRQHHDIVVQPFVAWQRSFPFLPAAALALRSVEELTEFLADDAARSRVGAAPLHSALLLLVPTGTRRHQRTLPGR